MGTDALGRDMASRVLHGGRVSLAVGLLTAFLAILAGLPLGALAGYRGGWVDAGISRVIETILCFPTLLLALAILAAGPRWLGGLGDVPRSASPWSWRWPDGFRWRVTCAASFYG